MAPKPYSATAPIKALKGSETNPSVTFSGDEDTGLYSSGNNEICVSADGSKKAKFNPDGLEINGDLNLDSGGLYSTTLQLVTPTANRSISFPDQTGMVGLVGGYTGHIQYNVSGKLKGTSDFVVDLDWNDAATTFTGLKLNATDTASAADSKLLDLQLGGTSQFRISVSDPGIGGGGSNFALLSSLINIQNYFGSPFILNGPGANNGLKIGQSLNGFLDITSSDAGVGFKLLNGRARLSTDAANTFAQRDGTFAQEYRIYNTYTDASNYERGFIRWRNNRLEIGPEASGTGSARNLKLSGPSALSSLTFSTAGITTSDHVSISSAFRAGGNTLVAINGTYQLGFTSTSDITSTVDAGFTRDSAGVVKLTDGSTGTGYLKLIPTTVGALTAAATVGAGTKAFVTDSTSTMSSHHGQAVVGGGNNFVPVFSDGTNWIIG